MGTKRELKAHGARLKAFTFEPGTDIRMEKGNLMILKSENASE